MAQRAAKCRGLVCQLANLRLHDADKRRERHRVDQKLTTGCHHHLDQHLSRQRRDVGGFGRAHVDRDDAVQSRQLRHRGISPAPGAMWIL